MRTKQRRAPGLRQKVSAFLRLFVLILSLPIGLHTAMPVLARMIAGPAAHICHCDLRGGDAECDCPICNPDRADLVSAQVAARGTCGEDNALLADPPLLPGVLPAPSILVFESALVAELTETAPLRGASRSAPPTPPPRASATC